MNISKSLRDRPLSWAFLIILTTTLIRYFFIASGQLTLVQDEAQYWDWTRHLQLSYYSKGPLISWIITLWTAVFGNTELGVRFGSVFNSMLTQAVLFFGVAHIFKRPALALWTLLVFNTMVIFCGLSILMTTDSPLILCYAIFIFALYSALRTADGEDRPLLPYVFLIASLAIGILAKYMMLIAVPQALIYAFLVRRHMKVRTWPKLITSLVVGTIIGILPILLWNISNDFVGFKHVAHLSGAAGSAAQTFLRFDRYPDYLGSQFALATPWWLFLVVVESWRRLSKSSVPALENNDLSPSHARILQVFFLPLFVFMFFWSFHTKIMPNWIAVSYVPGCILGAAGMRRMWQGRTAWARRLRVAIPVLAASIFILAHGFHALPIPTEYDPTRRVKGWRELGFTIDAYRNKFEDSSKVFVFSDQYDMTAALAFYVPGQPRTYCAWVDRRMCQYDLWPGPDQDKKGWDAILVLKDQDDPTPDNPIIKMFGKISEPIYVTTKHNGRNARTFTLFLCYDFNGYWPRPQDGKF